MGSLGSFVILVATITKKSDWEIKVLSRVNRNSVISQGHYEHLNELKTKILKQQKALGFIPYDKRP